MAKKQSTMRMIIKLLLDNTMVEFTSKDISETLKQSRITWHTSRLKAFILDNKDASDILKVRVAKGRESVFMCKAKSVDNPEEWATKLYKDYLAWERGESVKETKPNAIPKPKEEDKKEVTVPVRVVYDNDQPMEIPINIKITVSIKVE